VSIRDYPTEDYPTADYPTADYPTSDYPTADYPNMGINPTDQMSFNPEPEPFFPPLHELHELICIAILDSR
jgi:hypothetical protein